MPRETKMERELRESAERHATQNAYASAYPERLMAQLERVTNHCLDITVEDGQFHIRDRSEEAKFSLPYSILPTAWFNEFENLRCHLDTLDHAKEERIRKANIRSQALNKLTKEEMEELGLD